MPVPRLSTRRSTALLLLVALVAVVTGLLAGPAAADPDRRPSPGLTPAQARVVLRLVDDRCGDTWCEGDHLFDFRHFACQAAQRSCVLRLRIAPLAEPGVRPSWQWRSGRVHGFVRFREMVAGVPGGPYTLAPDFTAALDELVTRLAAGVR